MTSIDTSQMRAFRLRFQKKVVRIGSIDGADSTVADKIAKCIIFAVPVYAYLYLNS